MVTAKKILSDNEIQYEPGSIVDQSGRVFIGTIAFSVRFMMMTFGSAIKG